MWRQMDSMDFRCRQLKSRSLYDSFWTLRSGFSFFMNSDSLIFLAKLDLYPLPMILNACVFTFLCFVLWACRNKWDFLSFPLCWPVLFSILHLVSPVYWDLHFLFGHFAWYTTLCWCSNFILSLMLKFDPKKTCRANNRKWTNIPAKGHPRRRRK